jgi:HTH-type transcriptional regulator/antitoxin HigA
MSLNQYQNQLPPPDLQAHWQAIQSWFIISNERQYDLAIERLDRLLEEVGNNEQHPLYELLDTLGAVIHAYEEKYYPLPECHSSEMLQFFMEQHELTSSDLPELGATQRVTELLNGKIELTVSEIRTLANRFQVSPAIFI